MWVYLASWMVEDGGFPGLAAGTQLNGVGLRATCAAVLPAQSNADQLTELDGGRGRRYKLTGTVSEVSEVRDGRGYAGTEFVITVGEQAYVGWTEVSAPRLGAGARITVRCTFSVMADYEWIAFDLPDVRTDWQVRRLEVNPQLQRYLLDLAPLRVPESRGGGQP